MSAARHSTRRAGFGAALTLALKDLQVAWSYKLSFILGHFVVIGSLILFYFVSRVVGTSHVVGSPDEYFRFVVVGMAVGALVETAVSASMGAARNDQVQGTLEAVASLPVTGLTLGLGWLLYPICDAILGVVVTFLLALPLGFSGASPDWITFIVASVLSIVVFASFGFLGAAIVLAFQQGAGLVPLVLSAMALISGVLFPVSVMPGWLETISQASPLRHSLDSMRAAMLDHASLGDIKGSIITLAVFAVVLLPLSLAALELGLHRARQTGGLSRF